MDPMLGYLSKGNINDGFNWYELCLKQINPNVSDKLNDRWWFTKLSSDEHALPAEWTLILEPKKMRVK